VYPDEILGVIKVGKFTRFKPALKRKGKTPLEKFQEYTLKGFGWTKEYLVTQGITISDIVVHQDDCKLLEQYETEWALAHAGLSRFEKKYQQSKIALHLLNSSPTESRSECIKLGYIYYTKRKDGRDR